MHTLAPGSRGLCGTPGRTKCRSAGLPAKTSGVAFRASGGAGGDPELADAIHRHPRLWIPSAHMTRRSWTNRRVSFPGEGIALPLLPNCGRTGPRRPLPRGPTWSPRAPALGDRVQRESYWGRPQTTPCVPGRRFSVPPYSLAPP